MGNRIYLPLEQRFWSKVDQGGGPDSCWLWTGGNERQIGLKERRLSVRRLAYELLVGPTPEGARLVPECGVRRCVNPQHLALETPAVGKRTCQIDGCETKHYAFGWCQAHHRRWKLYGDPLGRKPRLTPWDRIEKPDGEDGCWLWTGSKSQTGYGQCTVDGKNWSAHRFTYTQLVGPIPDGLHLDHLCRNPPCVNPAHLEPVTPRENVARSSNPSAIAILYDTCMRGHPLNESNVYRNPGRPKERRCRQCDRDRKNKKNREEAAALRERRTA